MAAGCRRSSVGRLIALLVSSAEPAPVEEERAQRAQGPAPAPRGGGALLRRQEEQRVRGVLARRPSCRGRRRRREPPSASRAAAGQHSLGRVCSLRGPPPPRAARGGLLPGAAVVLLPGPVARCRCRGSSGSFTGARILHHRRFVQLNCPRASPPLRGPRPRPRGISGIRAPCEHAARASRFSRGGVPDDSNQNPGRASAMPENTDNLEFMSCPGRRLPALPFTPPRRAPARRPAPAAPQSRRRRPPRRSSAGASPRR